MDFKKATDILCVPVTHTEVADALDVSLPSVRQARLDPSATAHRTAPPGWQLVVADLAEKRARQLTRLAESLRAKS